jgi:hypothetical protein
MSRPLGQGAFSALFVAACAGPAPTVTWQDDVAPLLAARCTSCHQPGGVAFDLTTHASAAARAATLVDAVEAGRMPPWPARTGEGCPDGPALVDDPTVSDAERGALTAWADSDRSTDDASVLARPAEPPSVRPDRVLRAGAAWEGPPGDAVVCTDLGVLPATDAWIAAADIVPADRAATHHAVLLWSDEPAQASGWWPCAGEVGVSEPLLFWAPGLGPLRFPDDTALRVPPTAHLVLQVHVHTAPSAPAPVRFEPPEVALELRDAAPDREARLLIVGDARDAAGGLRPDPADRGAPEFRVPAGAVGHTETMDVPVGGPPDAALRLWAVGHHLHRFGVAMHTTLADGRCALDTPRWDPNWHRLYALASDEAEAWTLRAGDRVTLRCTYDNGPTSPGAAEVLAEAGLDAPVDVTLGAGGLEEMCSALLAVTWERTDAP